jgi:hypothetical protein
MRWEMGHRRARDAKDILGNFAQELAGGADDGFGKLRPDFGHVDPDTAAEKLDALLHKLPPKPASFSGLGVSGSPGKAGGSGGAWGGA